jgi:probable F420-dependent oxidoreductase
MRRTMKVRIGFALSTRGEGYDEHFGPIVDDLERLGFDSLWLSERLTSPILDPLIGLAYAAGRARRLKLGTSVLVLPGRNPALLAKELASLDRASGGRLLPAFGLGTPDPAEHQAFGVAPRERGPWLDEALPLLRRFWTEDRVDHAGPRFHYDGVSMRPRPLQQPLDLWLGGRGAATLRRVGRLADGWLPSSVTPAEAAASRRTIEEAAAAAGRRVDPEHYGAIIVYAHADTSPAELAAVAARRPDLDPADFVPTGLDGLRTAIGRYIEAGVSKFVVRPAAPPASWTAELEALAAAVLPLQT